MKEKFKGLTLREIGEQRKPIAGHIYFGIAIVDVNVFTYFWIVGPASVFALVALLMLFIVVISMGIYYYRLHPRIIAALNEEREDRSLSGAYRDSLQKASHLVHHHKEEKMPWDKVLEHKV